MKHFLYRHYGKYDRNIRFTKASFVINAAVGTGKLILGFYLLSAWFSLNGIYYLLLCLARKIALTKYEAAKELNEPEERYKLAHSFLRTSGFFLVLLGAIYFFISNSLYLYGDSIIYDGYLAFLVALIAFLKLSFAIYGTIATSRQRNPLALGLKLLNFADALVSIVFTQYILLVFTESEKSVESSAALGMFVSAVLFITGVIVFFRKSNLFLNDVE
ncbi:hypothetical protein R70723_12050 [Paenibacillus sp. FSL R7-0273]|uniref:hypothetical protein n=1 Tax=Paenibacillus sp. FSL R7-0273 TaxID=1536772 RepID=UPI0004F5E7F5|nr:hypothetical protein [Paenibacillus sp. FSL R7-0273]AIQ46519.1 hypothetical protein R70723_12050 [Paenibacillus sp. FSL R7-0273]OMF97715.1 hypothetical protein BK144_03525 [Paenibacillus sp. FSL R7-0273]